MWKFIIGDVNMTFVPSTITAIGEYHPSNVPGSRMDSYSWYLGDKIVYLFAGDYFTNQEFVFGDMWEFDVYTEQFRCLYYCYDTPTTRLINRVYNESNPIIFSKTAGESFKSHQGLPMLFGGWPYSAEVWIYNEPNIDMCRGVSIHEPQWFCSEHGICEDEICSCTNISNYYGDDCELWKCAEREWHDLVNACNGNGVCVEHDTCACYHGYYGELCQNFTCFGSTQYDNTSCNGNGDCVDFNTCLCYELNVTLNNSYFANDDQCAYHCNGFSQSDYVNVCSGHGDCVFFDTCECDIHYSEVDCGNWSCYGVNKLTNTTCMSRGDCIGYNDCDCFNGFFGPECDDWDCFGVRRNDTARVCSNHGVCNAPNECVCSLNFNGEDCNDWMCWNVSRFDASVCSGYGNCSFIDNCTCPENYNGVNCEIWSCFGHNKTDNRSCSGHGICVGFDTCDCKQPEMIYFGSKCDIFSCFGVINNSVSVCSGYGNCTDINNCECDIDHYGERCELTYCNGIRSDNISVCFGRGNCSLELECECDTGLVNVDGNSSNCECVDGFYGGGCEFTDCFGTRSDNFSVCSSNGICSTLDNCDCFNFTTGGGSNINQSSRVCECNTGFFGVLCDNTKCFGIDSSNTTVCNGRGECVGPDNCECSDDQIDNINTNSSTCECIDGYYGYNCELSFCYAPPDWLQRDNETDQCSGHGKCTVFGTFETDRCVCDEFYWGVFCEVRECYGVFSNGSGGGVCSDRGICEYGVCKCVNSPNLSKESLDCRCVKGYYGLYCNESKCHHHHVIEANDDDDDDHDVELRICNQHGTCVIEGGYNYDYCNCTDNWYGDYCEEFQEPYLGSISDFTVLYVLIIFSGAGVIILIVVVFLALFLAGMIVYYRWDGIRRQRLWDMQFRKPLLP